MSRFCATHIKERTIQELEEARATSKALSMVYGPESKETRRARRRLQDIEKELSRRRERTDRREN